MPSAAEPQHTILTLLGFILKGAPELDGRQLYCVRGTERDTGKCSQ